MVQSAPQSIDGILPEPRTELGVWRNWLAYANAMVWSKRDKRTKIQIRYIPKISDKDCPLDSRGRRTCEANGEHSWFNHAMDTAY